jgi:hypothetical protein
MNLLKVPGSRLELPSALWRIRIQMKYKKVQLNEPFKSTGEQT